MSEQLILVRHGETEHNVAGIAQGWGDSALSERGRNQVARLADRLRALEPDAVYSSTLPRALSTAAAIERVIGLPVQPLDDLREMNYGRWEGKSFLEVRRDDEQCYRRWIAEDDFPCPDGESHQAVLERMKRVVEAVSGSRRPVLVTHGTAIRIAATLLLNIPLQLSRQFAQDNAAVNVFVRRADRWVLKRWNDVGERMRDEG